MKIDLIHMYEMSDMAAGSSHCLSDDHEYGKRDSNHGDNGNETTSASIAPIGLMSEEEGVFPRPVTIRERKEEAFLDCMEALEDLLAARQALATSMRSGFFNVAQARYAMGTSRVGRLQYDSRDISATALVDIVGGRTSQEDAEDDDGIAAPQFVLQSREPYRGEQASDAQNEARAGEGRIQDQGLRQRKGKGLFAAKSGISEDPGTEEQALNAQAAERPGGSQSRGNLSPLSWFGALVSPHLRSAQVEFSQALSHAVRVANASARVERARAQFLAFAGSSVGADCCGSAGDVGEPASRTDPVNARNLMEITTARKDGASVEIELGAVVDHGSSACRQRVSEPFDERIEEESEIQVAGYHSGAGRRGKASPLEPESIVEELTRKYGL